MNQQEVIERSIYERLRLKAVSLGYTPDITTFANTPAGFELYKTALNTIATSKGYALEIFGSSSIDGKGQKRVPRISIEWSGFFPGDYSLSQAVSFEPGDDGDFTPTSQDINTYVGVVNVLLTFETTHQHRLLNQVVIEALTSRTYIPYYNDGNEGFLIEMQNSINSTSPSDKTKEWVYTFEIPDILFSVVKTGTKVPAVSEINLEIINHLGINF